MKIGKCDTNKKVIVIAEIGNNHEGSFARAEEMIYLAAQAGADAVKFQTYRTEHLVSRENKDRFNTLKSFELSFDDFVRLKQSADNAGVSFLSTPFDIGSAEFLNALVPAFKIASGDNTFYPLIETVARFAKPVILSCGLAGLIELGYAKALIERIWYEIKAQPEMALLHCVTSYPVPPAEANLMAIQTLNNNFVCVAGYSDHTLGIEAAALSVAAGARIVEKHFTLDNNFSEFRDHKLSADPKDFRRLVEKIRSIEEMLGTGCKISQESEKCVETLVRRSIVAARDLKVGQIIRAEDITWVRPGGGFAPGKESLVLCRKLKRDIRIGEMIMVKDIEG